MTAWTDICCAHLLLLFLLTGHTLAETKRQDKLFILQQENSDHPKPKLLVVTWSSDKEGDYGGCEFFDDQSLIDEVLNSTSYSEIQTTSEAEMKDLLEDCTEVKMRKKRQVYYHYSSSGNWNRYQSSYPWQQNTRNSKRTTTGSTTESYEEMEGPQKATTQGYDGWNVIFPGTKWCGAGDVAKNYDDLGLHADTDKCCRAHDLCNDTLAPGATRNNLTNTSPFTALSCKCDNDFYDCLDRVNSLISNKIGNLYFNVLKRTCYDFDYPLTKKCKTFRSFLKITCKEYARNTNAPKVYQWKSAKLYKKLPVPGPITVTLPF